MKAIIFAVILLISVSGAFGRTVSDQERDFIATAEEIAGGDLSDDEKIERLGEIERRVALIRKTEAEALQKPKLGGLPPDHPLITGKPFPKDVGNFDKKNSPSPGENLPDPPVHPLVRFAFWLLRVAGYAIVVGMIAATAVFTYTSIGARAEKFFHAARRTRNSIPRTQTDPVPRVRTGSLPQFGPPSAPNSGRRQVASGTVSRDGTVPAHLR